MLAVSADDPLLAARALVLHDLQARGLADAKAVSALEESVTQRRWWVAQWAQGADFVAGLVAQDVQDALMDQTGRWPLCQRCDGGDEHCLYITPDLGPDPHWMCVSSGVVVARLGRL